MKVVVGIKRGRPASPPKPSRDLGTAELIRARCQAVGSGDPVLATTPLGIMEARGLIDLEERAAGEDYRRLYGRAIGLGHLFGLDPAGNGSIDEALERITAQYRELRDRLRAIGHNVLGQVHAVAVYQQTPIWLMLGLNDPHKHIWRIVTKHQDYIDLRAGLTALLTRDAKRAYPRK